MKITKRKLRKLILEIADDPKKFTKENSAEMLQNAKMGQIIDINGHDYFKKVEGGWSSLAQMSFKQVAESTKPDDKSKVAVFQELISLLLREKEKTEDMSSYFQGYAQSGERVILKLSNNGKSFVDAEITSDKDMDTLVQKYVPRQTLTLK